MLWCSQKMRLKIRIKVIGVKEKKWLHFSSFDRSDILVACLYIYCIYFFSSLSFSLFSPILSSKCLCGSSLITAHSPVSPTSAPRCSTGFGLNRTRHKMCCPTEYPHRYFHQVILVQGHPLIVLLPVRFFYPFLSLTKLIPTEQKFKMWHGSWHDVHFCCLLWRISLISCLTTLYSNTHIYTVR